MWISETCGHCLCEEHLDDAKEASQCPVCLEPVEDSSEWRKTAGKKNASSSRLRLAPGQEPSTKMLKIAEIIKAVEAKGGPKAKTVVFSQFTQFLDLVEDMLTLSYGVRTVRIDGKVSRKGRDLAMAAFNSSTAGSPTVMLASLMAAGVGINLLGGCNVIICDLWWNPSVENQAAGRVHRIGQTEEVNVYRLVIAGSIEERLLEVHAAKMQMANAALTLRSPEELKDMNVRMLCHLIGGKGVHVAPKRGKRATILEAIPTRHLV